MSDLLALAIKDGSIVGGLVVVLFIIKTILPAIPKSGSSGNGYNVAIARIEEKVSNLQSMKEVIDGISGQIRDLSQDYVELTQTYTEKHAQLSERLARLESSK
jgi:hypothetical protein